MSAGMVSDFPPSKRRGLMAAGLILDLKGGFFFVHRTVYGYLKEFALLVVLSAAVFRNGPKDRDSTTTKSNSSPMLSTKQPSVIEIRPL